MCFASYLGQLYSKTLRLCDCVYFHFSAWRPYVSCVCMCVYVCVCVCVHAFGGRGPVMNLIITLRSYSWPLAIVCYCIHSYCTTTNYAIGMWTRYCLCRQYLFTIVHWKTISDWVFLHNTRLHVHACTYRCPLAEVDMMS